MFSKTVLLVNGIWTSSKTRLWPGRWQESAPTENKHKHAGLLVLPLALWEAPCHFLLKQKGTSSKSFSTCSSASGVSAAAADRSQRPLVVSASSCPERSLRIPSWRRRKMSRPGEIHMTQGRRSGEEGSEDDAEENTLWCSLWKTSRQRETTSALLFWKAEHFCSNDWIFFCLVLQVGQIQIITSDGKQSFITRWSNFQTSGWQNKIHANLHSQEEVCVTPPTTPHEQSS